MNNSIGCVGAGWSGILSRVLERAASLGEPVNFQQVKIKYGELVVYARTARGNYSPPGDAERRLSEILDEARAASLVTCEVCGAPAFGERTRVRCLACAGKEPVRLVCLSADGAVSPQESSIAPNTAPNQGDPA